MLDIDLWLTFVFNQENYSNTLTLNVEES